MIYIPYALVFTGSTILSFFGMYHFLLQISLVAVSMQLLATSLASMQKPFYGVTMY